jgi:hypothetical protein
MIAAVAGFALRRMSGRVLYLPGHATMAAEADVVDGVAVLPADARGRYAVVLQVKGADGDWRSVYGRPMQFEIGAGGEQVVMLEVDQGQVRALLLTGRK